jgi:hypothetical protein
MTFLTFWRRALCALVLASSVTAPLFAKVVADATYPPDFTFSAGTVLVPLTTGGATSISFSGKGKHAIHYSAECYAELAWVSIEILVDGVALSPTAGPTDVFCSDFSASAAIFKVTAHYTVATGALAAGVHTVRVRVDSPGGGSLGDSSLVVMK